ncbi:MAG TPA: Hsp70 family protein, partial [Acidimicrobiaceae bacterium]|nr:Hsp70 family protein [Acidimicrobiaceae bacterium]
GIDFDEAVMAHVRATLGDALEQADTSDPATREALAALRVECVTAKELLSSDSDATISVNLPSLRTQVRLTRAEFEDVVRPMVRETVQAMQRAVQAAGVEATAVKAVLLAGGSSRIPLVGELVARELGRPVVADSHPKHTVAMGAARVA